MGSLQTFFYLALISAVMIGLTLVFIGIVAVGLVRWFRQARGQTPLTFWLIGGAVTVVLLVIVLGTARVLYGFIPYGASCPAAAEPPSVRRPRDPGVGRCRRCAARHSDHRLPHLPPLPAAAGGLAKSRRHFGSTGRRADQVRSRLPPGCVDDRREQPGGLRGQERRQHEGLLQRLHAH